MDGSVSKNRQYKEKLAVAKFRLDLWGAFLLVAIVGNIFLGVIHTTVIEIPTGIRAVLSFNANPVVFRENLVSNGTLREDTAARKQRLGSRQSTEASQRLLWRAWPIVAALGVVWFTGSCIAIFHFHRLALAEFADGLQTRSDQYLMIDLSRLAHQEEVVAGSP